MVWWFKKCGLLAIVLVVSFVIEIVIGISNGFNGLWMLWCGIRNGCLCWCIDWLCTSIFFVDLKSNLIFVFLCLVPEKVHENAKKIWDSFFLIFKIINWNLMLMWNFYSYFICHISIKCANCAHHLSRKYFPLVS